MTKSTRKGKNTSKKKQKQKAPVDLGLENPEQALFFYGPPPAIKTVTQKHEYDKDFHPMDLLYHMRDGATRSEIVAAWGITYTKFNDWLEKYPELAEAFAVGKPAFEAFWKRTLRYSAFKQLQLVREDSLFMLLKNSVGFGNEGGSHEYGEGDAAELEFIYEDEK
jgi:hypothetical protein